VAISWIKNPRLQNLKREKNMKKFLSVLMVALMATSAFAFVPLTNSQLNIGSYQRGATRGMFYNELDIISAAPVELLDFSGNALYTNWSNIRNFNNITNYGSALDWSQTTNNMDVSYFTFGVTGNPLSCINIDDSRSGIVFQNYGAKIRTYDFGIDDVDSKGEWENEYYLIIYPTAPVTDITSTTLGSDLVYYTNITNTQWNIGSSYKLLDKISLGLSLSRMTNSVIRNTGGTKSYTDRYDTDNGATWVNMPTGSREGDTLTVNYPSQEIDRDSTSQTDILPQARLKISDDLYVDAGVGLRFSKTANGADPWKGDVSWEKDVVTCSAKEDIAISSAAGGQNIYQRYNTGTAIVIKDNANIALDYDQTNITGNARLTTTDNVYETNNWTQYDAGVSDFSDERSGTGPLLRVEMKKKFEKCNITGVANYGTISQDVDASVTNQEYVNTKHTLYAGAAVDQVDNFTEKDYIEKITYRGKVTDSNIDLGTKIEMTALEGVKLSFGGFIQQETNKADLDININSTDLVSYRDSDGLTTSSGTVGGIGTNPNDILNNKPGPVDGSVTETNPNITGRGDLNISIVGNGEGDWSQTISQTFTGLHETITTRYRVPIGIEIPLSKKWIFRAGTEYMMTKTKITFETTETVDTKNTTATALGEPSRTRIDYINQPRTINSAVTYAEQHDVFYTYGIQFDATPSLTIACNAFLDTATDTAEDYVTYDTDDDGDVDAVAIKRETRANIFDLRTYRQLSLSAAIKF